MLNMLTLYWLLLRYLCSYSCTPSPKHLMSASLWALVSVRHLIVLVVGEVDAREAAGSACCSGHGLLAISALNACMLRTKALYSLKFDWTPWSADCFWRKLLLLAPQYNPYERLWVVRSASTFRWTTSGWLHLCRTLICASASKKLDIQQ